MKNYLHSKSLHEQSYPCRKVCIDHRILVTKIAGELNGQQVKLVKFKGPFVWHHHEQEDEMFYVFKGSFMMELRDKNILLEEGDFLVVPKEWSIARMQPKKFG